MNQQRLRSGDPWFALQQFGQVNLVGALEDRVRIVNHHQALSCRSPGKAEGMVIDGRGFADKQSVELGQAADLVRSDTLDVEPDFFTGLFKTLDRARIRGWIGLVGIEQDRQVESGCLRRAARRGRLPEKKDPWLLRRQSPDATPVCRQMDIGLSFFNTQASARR